MSTGDDGLLSPLGVSDVSQILQQGEGLPFCISLEVVSTFKSTYNSGVGHLKAPGALQAGVLPARRAGVGVGESNPGGGPEGQRGVSVLPTPDPPHGENKGVRSILEPTLRVGGRELWLHWKYP